MTYDELESLRKEMDDYLGPIHSRWAPEAVTMRLQLECAMSLKYLEENGIGLSGVATRGSHLCVSVEESLV